MNVKETILDLIRMDDRLTLRDIIDHFDLLGYNVNVVDELNELYQQGKIKCIQKKRRMV